MFKKNKLLKTVFKTIKGIVSIFVLMIVGVMFVQRITNNEVALFGYSIFTVVSESMVPEYNVGDMIVAKRVDEDSIEIDDDVVYFNPSSYASPFSLFYTRTRKVSIHIILHKKSYYNLQLYVKIRFYKKQQALF